ncbi:MAG TPA: cellulose binding domain-containing protein, partial [Ktedonobacteraceae bacterium]|nr:cellulose binding domain-containing protein [Ktedonobacteraceae bacterium]
RALALILCLLGIITSGALVFRQSAYAASAVTIDGSVKFQTIDGFGFSEAFGRAASMQSAPAAVQQQMLDLLFSPTTGAGLTILRNIINSDTSSIEPNSPGSPSAAPQYVWDGNDSGQVWLSQAAMRYGVNQIYADAWSAPGYMKTNNDQANGGTLCGVTGATCSSGDWRQAYANYLVQYIKDYQSVGVPLSHVGFVNEPNLNVTYSSMVMSAAQNTDFTKVLGPTLRNAGVSTKLVCCDAEGWDLAPGYVNSIAADSTANSFVNLFSSHGYTAPPNSTLSNTGGKHVWETEWANFDTWDPAWDDGTAAAGFTWAQRIYTGLTSANLSAFLHWWGLNTSNTNSGLLHLNGSTVEVSKRFWAFANYSRFIRPGATRISASSANGLNLSAFLNSNGSLVIVALNTASSDSAVTYSLQNTGIANGATVTPYMTNASNDLAAQSPLSVSGGAFTATVPARSLVTYQIGGTTGVTPTVGTTATPTRGITPTPTNTPIASTPTPVVTPSASGASCRVVYQVGSQWSGGFSATLTITNTGTTAINGWTLTFTFPNGQTITQLWNGSFTQSGGNVTVTNLSYNATIAPGQTLGSSPGFNGSWNGTNSPPSAFKLNGATCSSS